MVTLFHVSLGDRRVGFHVMMEGTVNKEDALARRRAGNREERAARVTALLTREGPDLLRNDGHGFITVMLRQIWNLDKWLNYRNVLTEKATEMGVKRFIQCLSGVRDVDVVLHLHQDLFHVIM